MTSYLRCFLQHARYKALAGVLLMIVVGLLEGTGLLVLLPLLDLMGIGTGGPSNLLGSAIPWTLRAIGMPITLPVVLGLFVVLMSGQMWLRHVLDLLIARMENAFVVTLREDLYEAIIRANWLSFTRQRASDLTQLLTDEIQRIGSGTQQLLALSGTAGVGLVQVALALIIAPGLTFLALGCGGFLLLAVGPVMRRTQALAVDAQEKRRAMMSAISEHLAGMKIAKSQAREERHLAHFQSVINDIAHHTLEFVRVWAASRARYEIGAVIALALFLYCAVRFTNLNPAELLLFLFIFTRLLPRISVIQANCHRVAQMLPSFAMWQRLRDQFQRAQGPAAAGSPEPLPLRNEVRFERVTFVYHNESEGAALSEVDLVIPAGETTAICGVSGAGKSTLADLLMGLFQPSAGRVLIDGQPLEGATIRRWRRAVGYVPQEPFLFNDTVRANLLYAQPDATEKDLRAALVTAAADEFVSRLPAGLDTVVGDRGMRLSGGERQRLTLARAMLGHPSLLILDEATSALDNENERLIKEAINRLHGELTVVVIAHRLSTVRKADSIVVLDKGRVVERGSWEELVLRPASHFANMVEAQTS